MGAVLRRALLLPLLALAGCGSFPLGTSYPLQGQTKDDLQLAMLTCKDQAAMETNTGSRQAMSFIAGLTLIGVPFAIADERSTQRAIYKACMEGKGYRVEPPP